MIAAITLNSSIDRRYVVENAQWGVVHRVKSCTSTAGGKGLNVARVIHALGEQVIAGGFAGGFSGAYLCEMLAREGVQEAFVKVQGETRSCINVYDLSTGKQTEFLEPGTNILPEEYDAFLTAYRKLARECQVISLSGSLPRGLDAATYGELIRIAKENGAKVLLDTSGAALTSALPYGPSLIKPNEDEIGQLTGGDLSSLSELAQAAQALSRRGVERVVISLGGRGAILACEQGVYHGKPPQIQPLNTVGCGDAMTASYAVSFARCDDVEEALRQAVAVSAASALAPDTGGLDKMEYLKILPMVQVVRLL